MKAIQLEKPQSLRIIEIPEPTPPGPGEALVRVHRVGLCGTDYAAYLGRMPFMTAPRILGHELGVEILAIGQGVQQVQVGDRCTVEPYLNDPGSFATRQGHPNCCENLRVLGVHTDGGLRPRFVIPARKLHRANALTHDQAALVEVLAVGMHAARRGQCKSSEHVLVLGAGPLGLSAALAAVRAGAQVMVMDPDPIRLDFVRQRLRLPNVIQVLGDDSDLHRIEQCTGGHLAQCVIDTTGSHRLMTESVRFAAFGGRIVFAGLTNSELSFSHPFVHRRELSLLSSRNALPEDFKTVIDLMSAGELDVRHWITHTASFQECIGEFGKWLNPTTGTIRAVVRVEG